MKKLLFLFVFAVMLFLAACGGGESSSNGENGSSETENNNSEENKEVTVMKIGSTDKADVAMGRAMFKFEEIVEAETNGSIDVQVFPDSQLGGERDIFEGIQLGTIQGGPIGSAVISNFSPRFNLFSLPFVFPDRETSFKVLDGPLGQEILGDLEELGIIGFNFWESGVRHLTNSKREVKTLEDVQGLKLRTMESQLQLDVWTQLGASPTPMAFPELFTALQQGVVDGQENPYSVIAEAKFYEVQKYLTPTGHLISVNPFMVNKKFFDSLTSEQQEAIKKAAEEAQAFQREEKGKEDEKYLEELKEKGMIVTPLSPEERKKWVEAVQPVYDKYKKEIGEELVDRLFEEVEKNSK